MNLKDVFLGLEKYFPRCSGFVIPNLTVADYKSATDGWSLPLFNVGWVQNPAYVDVEFDFFIKHSH
jgi:hypothetical protein